MKEKACVLFVCTHNAARSQMAEALLRHHAGLRFAACSAGLEPSEVHPLTIRVLDEIGVRTEGLRAKGMREFLGKESVRYAIFVCQQSEASCPRFFPFSVQTLRWAFDDPTRANGGEDPLVRFRRVRGEIDTHIRRWIESAPVPV